MIKTCLKYLFLLIIFTDGGAEVYENLLHNSDRVEWTLEKDTKEGKEKEENKETKEEILQEGKKSAYTNQGINRDSWQSHLNLNQFKDQTDLETVDPPPDIH